MKILREFGYPLTRTTKIDEQILTYFGFKKIKKDFLKRDVWAMKPFGYPYEFHFTMGNYPATNPNCGVLSIYEPAQEVEGYDRNGKKKIYKYEESSRAIAHYVNTSERLRTIILALTEQNV